MTWVITRLCRDCLDMACVEVCPVDCIVQHKDGEASTEWTNQLYIDPEECIDCGVCEPECPWEAILQDEEVPEGFQTDIVLNAKMLEAKDDFKVPEHVEKPAPTPDQIADNKRKWSYPE